jgi:hypothetical protein
MIDGKLQVGTFKTPRVSVNPQVDFYCTLGEDYLNAVNVTALTLGYGSNKQGKRRIAKSELLTVGYGSNKESKHNHRVLKRAKKKTILASPAKGGKTTRREWSKAFKGAK